MLMTILASLLMYAGTLNVNGTYTTDFGDLVIKQKGTEVTGSYSYPSEGGVMAKGTIKGTLKSTVLTFTWQQSQGTQKAGGTGKFTFAANGKSFTGTWKDSKGKTGEWSGTRK